MLRPAKEACANQGKDGKTSTMKTEQAWNGLYIVAAAPMMMMMMMMMVVVVVVVVVCRSHLTVNTMYLYYKGKLVDVTGGGGNNRSLF